MEGNWKITFVIAVVRLASSEMMLPKAIIDQQHRYVGGSPLTQQDIDNNKYSSGSLVIFSSGIGWGLGVLVSQCSFISRISASGAPAKDDYCYLQTSTSQYGYTAAIISDLVPTKDPTYTYAQFTPGSLASPSAPAALPVGLLGLLGVPSTAPEPTSKTVCNVLGFGDNYQVQRLPSKVISYSDCLAAWKSNTNIYNELKDNPAKYFCLYPTSDVYSTPSNFSFHFQIEDHPAPTFCEKWFGLPIQLQIPEQPCTGLGIGIGAQRPIFSGFVKYSVEGTGVPPVVVEYIGVALHD